MTYRNLLHKLEELEDEQLDFDIMIDIDEEFIPMSSLEIDEKEGRLGDGHPYINID